MERHHAKQNGMSFSSWVVNNVQENLENRADTGLSRKKLEEENNSIKEELATLQKKLRDITIIKENLEKDIKKYRSEPFIQSDFQGIRSYDKNLIDILRNEKPIFLGWHETYKRGFIFTQKEAVGVGDEDWGPV